MRRFLRLLMASWILISLVASATAQPLAAQSAASPPEPVPASLTLAAGDWYIGATPPNYDPSKPVLLFVHGKGGSASSWWTDTVYHGANDMYAYAYQNGYRTAFVDLQPEGHMWDNGRLLDELLTEITDYFGVSQVTIIAHSKGGVDSNAASVHYGASGKIERIVTLGTPHWGTPLADLAYSTWTWWLAALLGQQSDATYVMQTGYMEYFRSITDSRDPSVSYGTLSGYKCGPVFTALWWGCVAIAGEDDGVVPVWSARKPGANHLRTGYWDHDEIRMGSRVWSYLSPQLIASAAPVTEEARVAAAAAPQSGGAGRQALGNLILRGGEVTGKAEGQAFPVESGVAGATFVFYASDPGFTATLAGPDGSTHQVELSGQVPSDEVFAGAWVGAVEVDAPAAGSWSLVTESTERAGYLMVASLDGRLQAVLDRGAGISQSGGRRNLALSYAGAARVKASQARAEVSLGGAAAYAEVPLAQARGGHRVTLELPDEEGIHNLTVTVTGILEDGSAFERTLVSSFAVMARGRTSPWMER